MLRQLMDSSILLVLVIVMFMISLFTPRQKSRNRKGDK